MYPRVLAHLRRYAKVPRLSFPVDEDGVTVLLSDLKMYSEGALFAPTRDGTLPSAPFAAVDDKGQTWEPGMTVRPWELKHGGCDNDGSIGTTGPVIQGIDAYAKPLTLKQDGGSAFALQWLPDPTGVTSAVADGFRNLPEFLATKDGVCWAVPEVPPGTKLVDQQFQPHDLTDEYVLPQEVTTAVTAELDPALGPFSARLTDGSELEYCWCRFIDQPALKHLDWPMEERNQLQVRIEEIHAQWTEDKCTLPPRSVAAPLISLDPEQLVTPPVGFEVGYVPVVLRQRWATADNGAGATPTKKTAADDQRPPPEQRGGDEDPEVGIHMLHRTRSYDEAMSADLRPLQSFGGRGSQRQLPPVRVSPVPDVKPFHRVVGGIVIEMSTPNPTQLPQTRKKRKRQKGKKCLIM